MCPHAVCVARCQQRVPCSGQSPTPVTVPWVLGPGSRCGEARPSVGRAAGSGRQRFLGTCVSRERRPFVTLSVGFSGLQEYVEAVTFQHFIKTRSLISMDEINKQLIFTTEDTGKENKTVRIENPVSRLLPRVGHGIANVGD